MWVARLLGLSLVAEHVVALAHHVGRWVRIGHRGELGLWAQDLWVQSAVCGLLVPVHGVVVRT